MQIDDSNNAPEFFRTRGALARTMAYLRALLDRQASGSALCNNVHEAGMRCMVGMCQQTTSISLLLCIPIQCCTACLPAAQLQDARLGLIHKFLWDRYRSVRQDLYIQGMDVSGMRTC